MQVGVSNMESIKNSTYNSMMPLIRMLRVFCLNCNLEESNFMSLCSIVRCVLTVCIIGCMNFAGLYYKTVYVYPTMDLSIRLTDFVQILYNFFQYVVDLYFVYRYKHICVEYYKQYDCIDNILKVTCFSGLKRKLLKTMSFLLIMWALSSSFDFGAWVLFYGWVAPVCHSIVYLFLLIKLLTTLDLIAHVIQIEIRLKIIGDMMHDCYLSIDASTDAIKGDCISNKKWLYMSNDKKETHFLKPNCDYPKEVKILTSCYLMLTEQISFINKIYGFRILLNNLSLLSDMIKLTNIIVRIVLGYQRTIYNTGYFPAVSSLFSLVTCAATLATLVNQCENTYRQRERIINIMDHLVIKKNPDENLRIAVICFRELIQDRPMMFNMANFFTLNYSLLVSLTSVVVTYTIILLQSVN